MSLPEFLQRFGTEQQCAEAVMAERWPEGFRCPGCGGAAHCVINSRALFQCGTCRRQTGGVDREVIFLEPGDQGIPIPRVAREGNDPMAAVAVANWGTHFECCPEPG
jgi:hypothetical protein